MQFFGVLALIACAIAASALPASNESRIVNGKDAELGQFPHQAFILVEFHDGKGLCGGSLVHKRFVLTAGHCVHNAKSFEVHLGTVHYEGYENDPHHKAYHSTKYHKHEKFNPILAFNDIALIELEEDVKFNEHVQPVKLVKKSNEDYTGHKTIASGFGLQHDGDHDVAKHLQYAPLTVISNKECTQTYNQLIVKDTVICAKGENHESICNGDSGGPLLLEETNELVGVVSFGHAAGCEAGLPGGFTRVTQFHDWIQKHLEGHD